MKYLLDNQIKKINNYFHHFFAIHHIFIFFENCHFFIAYYLIFNIFLRQNIISILIINFRNINNYFIYIFSIIIFINFFMIKIVQKLKMYNLPIRHKRSLIPLFKFSRSIINIFNIYSFFFIINNIFIFISIFIILIKIIII